MMLLLRLRSANRIGWRPPPPCHRGSLTRRRGAVKGFTGGGGQRGLRCCAEILPPAGLRGSTSPDDERRGRAGVLAGRHDDFSGRGRSGGERASRASRLKPNSSHALRGRPRLRLIHEALTLEQYTKYINNFIVDKTMPENQSTPQIPKAWFASCRCSRESAGLRRRLLIPWRPLSL